jgi:hypothetical protein
VIISKKVLHVCGTMAWDTPNYGPTSGGVGKGKLDIDLMDLPDGRKLVVVTSAYQFGNVMFEIERVGWDQVFNPGLLFKDKDRKALSDLLAILRAIGPEHSNSLFSGPIAKGMETMTKILDTETVVCKAD